MGAQPANGGNDVEQRIGRSDPDVDYRGHTVGYSSAPAGRWAAVAPASRLRAEFGAHLEANYPRLVSQLCMITLDTNLAHELVQDAYARAWQRWSTVRERPDPTGLILQMAVRASDRWWRRLMSRLTRSGEAAAHVPGHQAVLKALERLTPRRRRALVLADVAHLPLEEVARVEGVSVGVAEARLLRARSELTEALSVPPTTAPEARTPWEDM
ncbi:MAG: hypothetical protein JO100_00495 [Pseudonocardia sp.]|nr:hypothetical protein [Pseudonocardia sp.]